MTNPNPALHLSPTMTNRRSFTADPHTVQKERLDNIEMCKLFNAENSRKSSTSKPMLHEKIPFNPRPKRAILPLNDPAVYGLNIDEARRVESIVENLYDEEPEPLEYRKLNLETVSKVEVRLCFMPNGNVH